MKLISLCRHSSALWTHKGNFKPASLSPGQACGLRCGHGRSRWPETASAPRGRCVTGWQEAFSSQHSALSQWPAIRVKSAECDKMVINSIEGAPEVTLSTLSIASTLSMFLFEI